VEEMLLDSEQKIAPLGRFTPDLFSDYVPRDKRS
jgi:hypothetical protein